MHKVLRSAIPTCVLALALGVTQAHAQQQGGDAVARALNTVMNFRLYWMGDSTRVDACSVYQALGSPEDFPVRVGSSVRPLLDRTTEPCVAGDSSRVTVRWPLNYVRVDSVSVSGDSTARVHLTVRKQSEQRHFETYDVVDIARDRPLAWIREVRIWGIAREYLVRPGSKVRPPGH